MRNRKVLGFAREAGAAAALLPVCEQMRREGARLLLLAKDNALESFRREGLDCVEFTSFDTRALDILFKESFGSLPEIVFTSATSLPTLDMTERFLWQWARDKGIRSVGLLDQWKDYALRFSGPGENERLRYLPDHIFVMDRFAEEEMIKEGIPAERIAITGQPAFDRIIEEEKAILPHKAAIKQKLGIPLESLVITFVAESLRKDFGGSLGYDEQSILRFLGDALDKICSRTGTPDMHLIIKLHPENSSGEFDWALSEWPGIKKQIIAKELSPRETVAISDLVVGMSSIMLVEAIVAGRITVSLEIGSQGDSQCVAVKVGAVPFLTKCGEAEEVLERLLQDEGYRRSYLERQAGWKISTGATARCMEQIESIIKTREERDICHRSVMR